MPPFRCQGEANPFIERYFYDCIYNARDAAGFTFGMASIACWIFAQVPQFITNIKRQRADALSPWFLAEWLLVCARAISMSAQQKHITCHACRTGYFIFADTCLITQYIYFQALQHRKERLASIPTQRLRLDDPLYRHAIRRPASVDEDVRGSSTHSSNSSSGRASPKAARLLASLAVMLVLQSQWSLQPQLDSKLTFGSSPSSTRHLLGAEALAVSAQRRPDWVRQMGTVVGWSSSGFYLGSRLSQIWKNYSRHSAEGLSLAMFACAITANICYGLGIVLRAYSWDVVWSSAPWLLGSLGTVSLDLVIFTQGLFYAPKQRLAEAIDHSTESQPLFDEQGQSSTA